MAGSLTAGFGAAPHENEPASQTGNDDNYSPNPHDGNPGKFDNQPPPPNSPRHLVCTARDETFGENWVDGGDLGLTWKDHYDFLLTAENGLRRSTVSAEHLEYRFMIILLSRIGRVFVSSELNINL